ncbi:HK97 gp10 family phage protein [Aromatoleum evansii]|uniref:HK97 gp10 family phage protein n=1 Tax=Aromatoleum evansii TaxID=59406 RepID=UPI00145EC714|nr:HK97 gp10 family phage protein [Aromatoleum evansii]NMG32360.1 HK97 gp10 family phage protein [Aromatoleum evansii]
MSSFSQQLDQAIANVKTQTEQHMRKIIIETFTSVIRMSPVKTGRFRGNWQPGIDVIPEGPVDTTDRTGAKTIALSTAAAMRLPLEDGRSIYLINALPYALALEYGSSKQAPQGMVRRTLASIAAKYGV